MKRTRKIARIASVAIMAIITALAITALCAPEEYRAELAEIVENLDAQEDLERQIDWDSLPDEIIAWVEVPGTNIDEPIVQATPDAPNAYLYRDALGQGAYGTPYIDCECSIDSRFVLVYGHHMSDGSVFADFAQFIDEGFAREHSRMIIYERTGEAHELEVIAIDIVDASHERLKIPQVDEFGDRITSCDLILKKPTDSARIWAFATCSYQTWNSRTIVYSKPNTIEDHS